MSMKQPPQHQVNQYVEAVEHALALSTRVVRIVNRDRNLYPGKSRAPDQLQNLRSMREAVFFQSYFFSGRARERPKSIVRIAQQHSGEHPGHETPGLQEYAL